jgi:hypothetical protein
MQYLNAPAAYARFASATSSSFGFHGYGRSGAFVIADCEQ